MKSKKKRDIRSELKDQCLQSSAGDILSELVQYQKLTRGNDHLYKTCKKLESREERKFRKQAEVNRSSEKPAVVQTEPPRKSMPSQPTLEDQKSYKMKIA